MKLSEAQSFAGTSMAPVIQELIIVEDEPLISMMMGDTARELGWLVVGSAHSEADAFRLLERCEPSVAILDINLGLTTSLAVASSCRDRGIAVIFVTGYTARGVPLQCDAPILAKPFSSVDLERCLSRVEVAA